MTEAANGNADQIEYWNGPAGQRWAEAQEAMDQTMSSITAALLPFVRAKPGEAVLDIGCGSGSTTLAYAKAVGPAGRADGLDVSAPMLGLARSRAAKDGSAARFIEADAAVFAFKPEFDVIASRFGVMFFADPGRAFANIRGAGKPDARLAFVCWRAMAENAWALEPLMAARDLLPEQPPVDPLAPGPFAFADAARLRGILEGAGFSGVKIEALNTVMHAGKTADDAARFALNIGPLSRAASAVDEATRGRIFERVKAVMAKHQTQAGVAPPAACWLVGARV